MDAGDLSGVGAIVTGAAGGLGAAIVEAYLQRGARVAAHARDVRQLAPLVEGARGQRGRVSAYGADLAEPGEAARVGARMADDLGRVDVLINSAALLGERAPLLRQDLALWRRVLEVNITGLLAITREVVGRMPVGAAIVNVTSGAAGRAGWGAYAISKLAVNALTDMLREELADRRIRCVAVDPGAMRTPMRATAYPEEDPATLPTPAERVAAFVAIGAGVDPGPRVRAAAW